MKTASIDYERNLYSQGLFKVGGMDEAGRGPLAGPVTACVVILPQNLQIQNVYDSKTLSPKRREELACIIKEAAVDYALGWVDAAMIDEINILQATYAAMAQALEQLNTPLDALLIDGLQGKWIPNVRHEFIKGGDSASHSIAAASIVAKVARDKLMLKWHEEYPHYGFDTNKGYGTPKHIEAIRTHGLCPLHRHSFLSKIIEAK